MAEEYSWAIIQAAGWSCCSRPFSCMLTFGCQMDSIVYTYVVDHVYPWFILAPDVPKRNYFVMRGASVKFSCPCGHHGDVVGSGGVIPLILNLGIWGGDWSASRRNRSTAMGKKNSSTPWVSVPEKRNCVLPMPAIEPEFLDFPAQSLVIIPNVLYLTL